MKCRLHPSETGREGVCSSCLTERLEALMAERERLRGAASSSPSRSLYSPGRRSSSTETTIASFPEFPLHFPRSVSPYVAVRDRESLFFSTPQLNWKGKKKSKSKIDSRISISTTDSDDISSKRKRFSIFSALFRRRPEKPRDDRARISSSSSWFSSILPVRHKNSRLFPAGVNRISCRPPDRGMSPAAEDESADESCYFSDTPGIRRTPDVAVKTPITAMTIPSTRRWTVQHNPSGFAFCLSPLMRPCPTRCRRQEQFTRDRSVLHGEIRVLRTDKHLPGDLTSFRNRSRKLADFGKFP